MIKFNLEEKIIHRLIFESSFVEELGLFYGKMGIALCFFEYGRYTQCDVFTDIGEELLDNICNEIHVGMPFFFDSGLSGIGWGIEYLLQNHFIEGNSNEICKEIDEKIQQINLVQINDKTLETGKEGLYFYISARIKGAYIQNNPLPFDLDFINDLNCTNIFFANNIKEVYDKYPISLKLLLNKTSVNEDTYSLSPLGMVDGLAGYILTQVKQHNI